MEYKWAIASYRSNDETGKKALELAQAGIGYHVMNKDRAKNDDLHLAFKFASVKPLPHHLEEATPEQARKLEEKNRQRQGQPTGGDRRSIRSTPPEKVDFRKVFDK